MQKYGIVIHGGAGTIRKANMTDELEQAYRKKLTEALDAGYAILDTGGSSIDAVEATIRVMEDSPLFNAGKGAVFTREGKHEMDASIMEGKHHNAGAVAGVTRIKNPVTAARAVMEQSQHVLLAGEGAHLFSEANSLEMAEESYFFDKRRWEQFQKIKGSDKFQLDHSEEKDNDEGRLERLEDNKFGTVGAVALDQQGNLAAATSTGGMTNKRYGRIGDSPLIGAGTYADNATCGVSGTGHGEYFMRYLVAYDIAALMAYQDMSVEAAAQHVIMKKLKEAGGRGGIIAMDAEGNIAMPFNTPGMYRGFRSVQAGTVVKMYK